MATGFYHHKLWFSESDQQALLKEIWDVLKKAPLYTPTMPKSGKPFSVRETNCGTLGWVADINGYRYQELHPETKEPWPAIPKTLLSMWQTLAPKSAEPECCLINYYKQSAKMGLHQDKDEEDFTAPIVSVSLGQSAIFRIGGLSRRDKTSSLTLNSGDVIVMSDESRLFFHGIDRLIDQPTKLDPLIEESSGGRINLTMRRVHKS